MPQFEVNDLVVCWLNNNEVTKLLRRFGTTKLMPRWSEPCRIVKFKNKQKTIAIVKSIWHADLTREVATGDMLRLPKEMHQETLDAAKYEMLADLKRAAAPPTKSKSAGRRLERVPWDDREKALENFKRLEQEWPTRTKPELPSATGGDLSDTDVVVEVEDRPKKNQKRSRKEVHVLGSWVCRRHDAFFQEREDEPSANQLDM